MSDYRQLFEERKNKKTDEADGYIGVYVNEKIFESMKFGDALFSHQHLKLKPIYKHFK